MGRRNLARSNTHFYHVTTRSNHRHWFKIDLQRVWRISELAICKAMEKHPAIVAQYVLMNNHYHLLIKTPNMDLDRFMYFFNKTFSERLRRESGEINRMFGSRYKASLINSYYYLETVYRYIYQNPLRAQIVSQCQDYPFSTLHYQSQERDWVVPTENVFKLDERSLEYLNEEIKSDKAIEIQKGLKKVIYKAVNYRK